jgi:hypothetical protein
MAKKAETPHISWAMNLEKQIFCGSRILKTQIFCVKKFENPNILGQES